MSPNVPGVPGLRLPEPWEKRVSDLESEVRDLKVRLSRAEGFDDEARKKLDSINEFDEDSIVTIPTDAPPRAKVILGFASGLTPNGRLIIGLAVIIALVVLALRSVKLF